MNETAQSISLPRYTHAIRYRHDFTPDIGVAIPVAVHEFFPGRHIGYRVNNVLQAMPLAGDCKQDLYMYTESVATAWHAVWAKWPLFRYGKLRPISSIVVPTSVPTFTIRRLLNVYTANGGATNSVCPWLKPGSLLDSLYGLCNLLYGTTIGNATVSETLQMLSSVLDRPISGLYLRAYYHHMLINHTNEWLNSRRGDMINDEYPYRNDDSMSDQELREIFIGYNEFGGLTNLLAPVLQERDYFTSSNPEPQKGSAVATVSGQTIQDLTKSVHQQEILEKDADSGNSHYEAIVARYGVIPRSLGVMRPVKVADPTRQVVSINPIFNQAGDTTAPSSAGTNGVNFQGDVSGRGFSADGSHYVDYTADIDGCLMTLVFIRPETVYHQGLNRMFTRLERSDFFEPAMITDGDEPIYNEELYFGLMSGQAPISVDGLGRQVFGYRNKYMDYLYTPSRVSGQFHTTMNYWSLHRDFSSRPNLNDTFVRNFDIPKRLFSYEGQSSRSGYPRFVCYMQFVGEMHDPIPNYTKREI